MNQFKAKKVATALAILGAASILSGCGGATPPPVSTTTAAAPAAITSAALSCIPMSAPIGFAGTGAVGNFNYFYAGTIPALDKDLQGGGQFGGLTITAGGATGPYKLPNNQLTVTPDGAVSLNFVPISGSTLSTVAPSGVAPQFTAYNVGTYGAYSNPALSASGYVTGSITGTVTVSSARQSMIYSQLGISGYSSAGYTGLGGYFNGSTPYTTPFGITPTGTATSGVCVTGIAISLSHDYYNLYDGRVYLYMNGSLQHGAYLDF